MHTFRELIDLWDAAIEKEKITGLIGELVFFFKKDGSIYGAPENSRLVFANIKHPDKDTPKGWKQDATFTAVNLSKAQKSGIKEEEIFSSKDLGQITIIDFDQAQKLLAKAK